LDQDSEQLGGNRLVCRIIGDPAGYARDSNRLEFVGFAEDLEAALSPVSVVCAPMAESGGTSTKVLASLIYGKRTVCTPEAAKGITRPPVGLWVADKDDFAEAVSSALLAAWSERQVNQVRDLMLKGHGPAKVAMEW